MKKIALILTTKPEWGGQHQYELLVVESLLKRAHIDYELIAICEDRFWMSWCRKHSIKQYNLQIPQLSINEKNFNLKHSLLAKQYNTYFTPLGDLIRKQNIDILFLTQQGILVPNYKVKIVIPSHDLMHRYEPNFPEVSKEYELREINMKCMAKYATCILTDSILGKKQFEESYMSKKRKKPYIVSLPFVVPEHIRTAREEYIKVPEKYIFYPAQFWKHKNHMNLLRAIKILNVDIQEIHLVLVGSEKNNYEEVAKYIADNRLEDNVTILGFVSNENITYLYKHAVGMVMPSYFGPTNIPPLEAMALGCPVAVSNKYAMPEQVGKAGLLFDPDSPKEIADCIRKMWTDSDLREKMKELGYKRAGKWTNLEFGERLRHIINKI